MSKLNPLIIGEAVVVADSEKLRLSTRSLKESAEINALEKGKLQE